MSDGQTAFIMNVPDYNYSPFLLYFAQKMYFCML